MCMCEIADCVVIVWAGLIVSMSGIGDCQGGSDSVTEWYWRLSGRV